MYATPKVIVNIKNKKIVEVAKKKK